MNLNQSVAKLNATGQRSGDLLPYAAESLRRANDMSRLGQAEHVRFAKHIHVLCQLAAMDGRQHLVDDQIDVTRTIRAELFRNLVRAQECWHDANHIVEAPRYLKNFCLVDQREPVARFNFNGGCSVPDRPAEPNARTCFQFIFRGRPGLPYRGQDSTAAGGNGLIRFAAGPPFKRVSRSRLAAPNSSRATSPRRSTDPSGLVRTTIFSNSATELSRPWVWMLSCSCCSFEIGRAPMRPTAA